jgi:hypothetical protein
MLRINGGHEEETLKMGKYTEKLKRRSRTFVGAQQQKRQLD